MRNNVWKSGAGALVLAATFAAGFAGPVAAVDLYLINQTVDPLTLYVAGARACDAAPGAECKADGGSGGQIVRVVTPTGKTLETKLTVGPDPLRWTVYYGAGGGGQLAGKTSRMTARKTRRAAGAAAGPWFVQLGSFADKVNADRLAANAGSLGAVTVQSAKVGGKTWHRVRVGPAANRKDALAVWVQARKSGYTVAQIVR